MPVVEIRIEDLIRQFQKRLNPKYPTCKKVANFMSQEANLKQFNIPQNGLMEGRENLAQ